MDFGRSNGAVGHCLVANEEGGDIGLLKPEEVHHIGLIEVALDIGFPCGAHADEDHMFDGLLL